MLMVSPVTSNLGALRFAYSVRVEPSPENGLTVPSVVMVFQMRAIDKARVVRRIGRLSQEDITRIDTEILADAETSFFVATISSMKKASAKI